jgi:alkylation response protein AidB-like acyl-CoA dehydrogenase
MTVSTTSAAGPGLSEVTGYFREHAAPTDRGDRDVRPGIRMLGARGLLDLGAGDDGGPGLVRAATLVDEVAGECMSSAFALWAQRMVLEYLVRAAPDSVAAEFTAALATGKLIGSTAMAPALRDVAGIEPVPVIAERTATGLRLTGSISWASNLFPDAVVVLPVRLADESRAVVVLHTTDAGFEVAPSPELLALNATGSSSVRLTEVEVPADAVLSTDLAGFVATIRPTFLLLQTAFCSGLTRRSLAEAAHRVTGLNAELAGELTEQQAELADLRARMTRFARSPREPTVGDLLRLRMAASHAAVAATRLEATVRGGGGYLAASGTSRRLREAAFLPIQSPTEGQLRWELSHSA